MSLAFRKDVENYTLATALNIIIKIETNFKSISLTYYYFTILLFLSFFFVAGGKPITPNDVTDSLTNGHTTENGAVVESVTKTEVCITFFYVLFRNEQRIHFDVS